MMDFKELVRKRFSARSYRPDAVEPDKLDYILECARLAPSAVNYQPWQFLVVKSEGQKENLRQCYNREWFKTAPLYIVVCADRSAAWVRKSDNKSHADIDAAIAAEHICLAAAAVGLGSCWVCNFDPVAFAKCFALPESVFPVAIVPLGYVDKQPGHLSERKSVEDIVTIL